MQCLCRQRLVSALPYRRTKKEEEREKATRLSPISVPYQKKNGSYARKAKGEETVVLSSSEFLGEITAYLLGFTRADCCVTVRGEVVSTAYSDIPEGCVLFGPRNARFFNI